MRMWNVDPSIMCRQHLLGEHNEMHKLVGAINKGKSIRGYIEKGLVEVHNIRNRHDELAEEMGKRGYRHRSPLPKFRSWRAGKVFVGSNIADLVGRCKRCRQNLRHRVAVWKDVVKTGGSDG